MPEALRAGELLSFRLSEVQIAKNVRSRTNQLETYSISTSIARGEKVRLDHNDFVRLPMTVFVNGLVNAAFLYRISGLEYRTIRGRAYTMCSKTIATLFRNNPWRQQPAFTGSPKQLR
jgi:hypothetical protein